MLRNMTTSSLPNQAFDSVVGAFARLVINMTVNFATVTLTRLDLTVRVSLTSSMGLAREPFLPRTINPLIPRLLEPRAV